MHNVINSALGTALWKSEVSNITINIMHKSKSILNLLYKKKLYYGVILTIIYCF